MAGGPLRREYRWTTKDVIFADMRGQDMKKQASRRTPVDRGSLIAVKSKRLYT